LVLVTGPTGSGKSSTGFIINAINERKHYPHVTIEDPMKSSLAQESTIIN